MATGKLHIAFLPWLALDHLLPFYHLAARIASLGHRISFLSSPRYLLRLPPIPPHLSDLFTLVQLPVASNIEQLPNFRIEFHSFQQPVRSFLRQQSPNWIIFNYAAFWLPALAKELGISSAFVSIFDVALAFLGPPSVFSGGEEGPRTGSEQGPLTPEDSMKNWVGADYFYDVFLNLKIPLIHQSQSVPYFSADYEEYRAIKECQLVAFRSSYEFEPDLFTLLQQIYRKPVIPTGFYSPRPQLSEHRDDSTIQWLDKHKPRSVLYAAVGNETKLTGSQVLEIARGLELSSVPFVWVLTATLESVPALPDGFVDGLQGRGVVRMGWAPQTELQAHEAVGGFLTHAGWGSIVEGLSQGLAMVTMPFMLDQEINSRNLVEKGLGVEVARNEEDGSYVGEAIAEAVRLAMVDEKGEAIRDNAMKAKGVFGDDELNEKYVERFVDHLAGNFMKLLKESRNEVRKAAEEAWREDAV